ncbi:hypothetical protein EDB19DRAFT_863062 [Suillus lakei]|nr:hypothetical protein EDB19DRAFT_863062 [Suillus lakei]
MYLAEDHILCFEIVTKKEGDWILKYAKSVKATTDVCTADLDVWAQAQSQVFSPNQIHLQCSPAHSRGHRLRTFYLAFYFEASSATSGTDSAFNFLSQGASHDVFEIFLRLYIALLFVVIVCSLGNRPRGYKWIYVIRKILLGICNVIMLWTSLRLSLRTKTSGISSFHLLSRLACTSSRRSCTSNHGTCSLPLSNTCSCSRVMSTS